MPSAPSSEDVAVRDAPAAKFLSAGPASEVPVDRRGRPLARDQGALDRGGVAVVAADEDAVPERDRSPDLERWGHRRQGRLEPVADDDPPAGRVAAVDLADVAQDVRLRGVAVGPVEQTGRLDEVLRR